MASGGYRPGAGRPPKNSTKRTRGSVWMDTRDRIFARDKWLCQCQNCQVSGQPLPATEVDHVVPLRDGGANNDSNLQALNADCHKRKSKTESESRAAGNYSTPAAAKAPLDFLIGVMNDASQDPRLRVRAATAAAQYVHGKADNQPAGKKEQQNADAVTAQTGTDWESLLPTRLQ